MKIKIGDLVSSPNTTTYTYCIVEKIKTTTYTIEIWGRWTNTIKKAEQNYKEQRGTMLYTSDWEELIIIKSSTIINWQERIK